MLTKPSTQALRGLYSLSRQPAWGDISKYLNDELTKTYEHMATARDDATVRQMQGRAQFVQEFQALVRDVPSLMEKLGETTL